ncbi:MAG: thioesterase family protein [Acidobacteriota bacterium]|nr:thioesterase family protein [Acidobacteriota bacterium]
MKKTVDPSVSQAISSTVDIEVRYAETDQMGVVHHANYIIWFEQARTELCKDSGFHYAEIEDLGYLLIVTKVEVRYGRACRYGDTVQVRCWLDRMGSRGLRFAYEVARDGKVLTTGATEHLWMDKETRRPTRIPEPLREPFERLAGVLPAGVKSPTKDKS